MRNVLVYVAGPISKGDLAYNIKQAHYAGLTLLKAGIACIVPHGSCFWGNRTERSRRMGASAIEPLQTFFPEVLPTGTTHADWYGMDLVIVSRCDAVLRLPGESTGAALEVDRARTLRLPVFHSVEEVIAWADGRTEPQPANYRVLEWAPSGRKCVWEGGSLARAMEEGLHAASTNGGRGVDLWHEGNRLAIWHANGELQVRPDQNVPFALSRWRD